MNKESNASEAEPLSTEQKIEKAGRLINAAYRRVTPRVSCLCSLRESCSQCDGRWSQQREFLKTLANTLGVDVVG